MLHPINRPPYAIKCNLPVGPLDATTAELLFGASYSEHGIYSVGTDGFAHLHTSDELADTVGLGHYFDGSTCRNGHIATRKKRPNRRETQCDRCRLDARKTARHRR